VLWSVYWAFKLLTGKEGMGFGDFKLLAAIGAWLGWALLPLVILLSSLVGAVVGIALIVLAKRGRTSDTLQTKSADCGRRCDAPAPAPEGSAPPRRGRNIPIPFGPYLAGGGLIALFWGQSLTQSYLQLLAP